MATQIQPLLQVAAKACILDDQDNVLIMREAKSGKNNTKVGYWGLVGGRLEAGESFWDGLQREVLEETGLNVVTQKPLYIGEWRPTIRGVEHHIIAIFMLCRAQSQKVTISAEHDKHLWINPKTRSKYMIMEPDCYVIDKIRS